MKLFLIFALSALSLLAQSNELILCDQQAAANCFTLSMIPNMTAGSFGATWPNGNAAGALTNGGTGTYSWIPSLPLTAGYSAQLTGELLSVESGVAFNALNGYIQAQGFVSAVSGGSWQGFNTNTDGALIRGYAVAQSISGTAGGYIDFAPIAYSPSPGYSCFDAYGNPVNQPAPLPGLSAFGTSDVLMWNSPSPLQGYHAPFTFAGGVTYFITGTPCAAPTPLPTGSEGLNLNSYIFANDGLASGVQAFNAIQAYNGGGMLAQAFTAAGLYPAGTQLRSGFTVNSNDTNTTLNGSGQVSNQYGTYLGGYVYTGFADTNPGEYAGHTGAAGTCTSIGTCDNPFVVSETPKVGEIAYNTTLGCEVVYGGSSWGCIGGGSSYWTLAGSILTPTSATYSETLGSTSQGSILQIWAPASTAIAFQINTTGTLFTPYSVDGYGDVSGGGSANFAGNVSLGYAAYRVSGVNGVTSTTCTQWTGGICTHN